MTTPFAWFDNIGSDRSKTTDFLSKTFDWASNDIRLMTFLTKGEGISGWVPYVEVHALPEAVAKAKANGAVETCRGVVSDEKTYAHRSPIHACLFKGAGLVALCHQRGSFRDDYIHTS